MYIYIYVFLRISGAITSWASTGSVTITMQQHLCGCPATSEHPCSATYFAHRYLQTCCGLRYEGWANGTQLTSTQLLRRSPSRSRSVMG